MRKRKDKAALRREGVKTGMRHNPPRKRRGYVDGDVRKGKRKAKQ